MKSNTGRVSGDNNRRSTGDPWLDLLGAIIHRAIRDARKGDRRAAMWLWSVAPTMAGPAIDNEMHRPRRKPQKAQNNTQWYKMTTRSHLSDSRAFGGVDLVVSE